MSQLQLANQQALRFQTNTKNASRRLISLTPLIDVVFILLVFFMLASNFIEWASINVSVAPVSEVQGFDQKDSMLLLVEENQFWFNEKPVELSAVSDYVFSHLQVYPDAVLHVQPKANTSIQIIVDVLDNLQQAGISNFTLVPDPNWTSQ